MEWIYWLVGGLVALIIGYFLIGDIPEGEEDETGFHVLKK